MVQNAAAHILTGSSKYDHIDSVLASLHWLRTQIQADFEVLLLTYEVVNGQAPSHLYDLVNLYVKAKLKTYLFNMVYGS